MPAPRKGEGRPEILYEKLGVKVRQLRKERDLTQSQLGDEAGLSYKYVGEIERAEKNPSIGVLNSIAEALQVSLPELIDGISVTEFEGDAEATAQKVKRILVKTDKEEWPKIVKVVKVMVGQR